ncbi:MAG: AraC family transcriptional regulator [Ruminococcaceae bacterium]|nr:AraC family transcriptional regulator [Oscillospiraceae bacterium]
MEWFKQLNEAIDYVESNLDGEISYEEAAKIACCSTYYFQRMFSYVVGVPLSEYIRRRRMTKAAFALRTSEMKIMDIGSKYGYVSSTSFNRAFQSVHGVPPSAARLNGTILRSYPRVRFSIQVTGDDSMQYRIETKEAIRVVGVRTPLQDDMEQNQNIVPVFWKKLLKSDLFTEICSLANQSAQKVMGITACQDLQDIYYYVAAVTDQPVPDGMFELEIPEATWAVFECDGRFPESVQTVFRHFLTEWLPFSGYEYAKLPDIEVYPILDGKSKGRAEVWIAIKKEK